MILHSSREPRRVCGFFFAYTIFLLTWIGKRFIFKSKRFDNDLSYTFALPEHAVEFC